MSKNTNTKPKAKTLPAMTETLEGLFESFTELSASDKAIFIAHANERIRVEGVERSRACDFQYEAGDRVVITAGNPKYIGQLGTIEEARRVRVFVKLDSNPDKSPVYLFASDVEPLETVADENDVESDESGDDELTGTDS